MKLLVHDGFGVWCAVLQPQVGRFVWVPVAVTTATGATPVAPASLELSRAQFDALVLDLPWQRLPEMSVITRA